MPKTWLGFNTPRSSFGESGRTVRTRQANTFREVFIIWLVSAADDVWHTARFLVSGVLLNSITGRLRNSIFQRVHTSSMMAEVGTALPYGVTWELYGETGPLESGQSIVSTTEDGDTITKKKPLLIQKGASASGVGSQTRFRQATYTRVHYKPPVRFLARALEIQMTGSIGRSRLRDLGIQTGRLVGRRFARMVSRQYPGGVTVRGGG